MKELIKGKFEEFGFNLTENQIEQFDIYAKFLLEENQKYNLTAITDCEEIVVKHFIDSVLPIEKIKGGRVIDIGSGAGFPGVPLKILKQDIDLTLVDSLQKRVNFLLTLTEKLHLQNVKCVHSRAEDYVNQNREKFDYALSRAVAGMPTLCEYLLPFLKVGGRAIIYKGSKGEEELNQAEKAIKQLGGELKEKIKFNYDKLGDRKIYILQKIAHTDKKYPRGKNLPKTKPII